MQPILNDIRNKILKSFFDHNQLPISSFHYFIIFVIFIDLELKSKKQNLQFFLIKINSFNFFVYQLIELNVIIENF